MVDQLRAAALQSQKKRCRLCFHAHSQDAQHEMLIVMHRSSYVRPHRHNTKVETLSVIEGEADAVLFNENGYVADLVKMTPPKGGGKFFYHMPVGLFHTLVFQSEWFVFIETTVGPFDDTASDYAGWAPDETQGSVGHAELKKKVDVFLSGVSS